MAVARRFRTSESILKNLTYFLLFVQLTVSSLTGWDVEPIINL